MALSPRLAGRLADLQDRHEELAAILAEPGATSDRDQFAALSREYAELDALVATWARLQLSQADLNDAEAMVKDEEDADMRAMAADDARASSALIDNLEAELQHMLLPRDPDDDASAFLEIRAGTGGDEAALFAGDLLRMYLRHAENRGWQFEILSARDGEVGGYKEVICRIGGRGVYGQLKFESGAHRVQRVPATESQGRIHTSACTVAILPEPPEMDEVTIDKKDLRIDTYRASGAGGQHVNKTDSAVRLTHLPTGIVVECQDERSQHKNKARAMSLLKARLNDAERNRQESERADTRRNLVGSGDRSERIRTYNFPQGRITDHRINLTLYKLAEVLEGDLEPVLQPLLQEHQADLLADLGDDPP